MSVKTAFSPFRAVGSVCSDVAASYTLLYGEPVVMVPLGRTFLLYRGKELTMLRGGPTFEHEVSAVAQTGRHRFVGEGGMIHAFSHHKPLWSCAHAPITRCSVKRLLARDDLLFSYGADHMIVVRHVKTGEVLQEIAVHGSESVSAMIFPEGYNNKLLVATHSGQLQLYNFRAGKLLMTHRVESDGAVTALETSAYKDIVAYGTSTGRLAVIHLSTMEEICSFRHEGVAVTAIAFRSDKDGFVCSGTSAGEIAVWDLTNKALDGVLTRSKQVTSRLEAFDTPHTEAVHSLMFFPKGSLMVSAAGDNALMQFRFDTVDGLGLVVRERRGHMGECTSTKFYNTDLLVTGGVDQALRVTHVFSDRASWELSQGKLGRRGRDAMVGRETLKLPPAVSIDANPTRNYQWGSIVTIHESSALLCSWRMDTRAFEQKLSGIQTGMHCARAVAMSGCGNFAVVGYSSGNATIINLQNKSIRQLVAPASSTSTTTSGQQQQQQPPRAHQASVESIHVAAGNSVVVSSGLDGTMSLWELIGGKHIASASIRHPVTLSCLHEPSSLLITVQLGAIQVYSCAVDDVRDAAAGSSILEPVRSFVGHKTPVVAVALTPDTQRHVVSTSADGVVMLSDLAAGVCVGLYLAPSPITSLSFHPDGLFLATTHLGERGAFLWTNNLRYGFVPDVILDPQSLDISTLPKLHCPTVMSEQEDADEEAQGVESAKDTKRREEWREAVQQGAPNDDEVELFDESKDTALAQRQKDMAHAEKLRTLPCAGLQRSGLPRSVWFNLTAIDQIREKNQPVTVAKKKDAPFFLPTTAELRPTFIIQPTSNQPAVSSSASISSRFKNNDLGSFTPVQQAILQGDFVHAMTLFKVPNASATEIDLQLRTMVDFSDDIEYTEEETQRHYQCLVQLLKFLEFHASADTDVDLVQGMIAATLKAHGAFMVKASLADPSNGVVDAMEALERAEASRRLKLQHLVGYPNCLLSFFTGAMV